MKEYLIILSIKKASIRCPLSAPCLSPIPACFGRNISSTITVGFLEELDVTESHQAPPFSVILWRMFVRRALLDSEWAWCNIWFG